MPSTTDWRENRTFERKSPKHPLVHEKMGRLNKVPEMTMPYTATVREDQTFKEIPRKHHTLHGQKIRFEREKNENNIPSATNSNQKGKKNNYFTN